MMFNSAECGVELVESYEGLPCVISPTGTVIAGPLMGNRRYATADFEDCKGGKLDFDVIGGEARGDAFELDVREPDINPPPGF